MKLAVFSGTSDGRQLCERLAAAGVSTTVCVATAYGENVMPNVSEISVHTGRMDCEEMIEFLKGYDAVVDATHPYAEVVTRNVKTACETINKPYYRLLRPESEMPEDAYFAASVKEAADYLNTVSGKALLTTGSRELEAFTAVRDYADRLYLRVLPAADVVEKCLALGFSGKNLICMQGPFSEDMNAALLRQTGVKYLVTKDSGELGGFMEKLSAAKKLGVQIIVITRPGGETGYSLRQLEELFIGKPCEMQKKIYGRFPLFVDITGKPCVIIGGGKVACRRAKTLLSFGAKVKMIAPEIFEKAEGIICENRGYKKGDCKDAYMAVAATNNPEVNRCVEEECREGKIPVSVADCSAACTFFFPAVCQHGKLTVGVVSDGTAHHLTAVAAERIRTVLEDIDNV